MTDHSHKKHFHEWEFWDWHSIAMTLLFFFGIIVVIAVLVQGPDYMRDRRVSKLDKDAMAEVVNIHKQIGMYEGREGNKPTVEWVTVEYKYAVGGNIFICKDIIRENSARDVVYVQKFLDSHPDSIHIKFSSKNPSVSQIVIE